MPFDPLALPIPDFGLRCLQCHYLLNGLMAHRCPECGRPFTLDEHIPPGDWPVLLVDGQGVDATSEALALLIAAKIPIFPFSSSDTAPHGMSRHFGGTAAVLVARIAYWDAVDAFTRYSRGEPVDIYTHAESMDWTCVECGEANPGTFDLCWHCEEFRPGVA